MGYACPVCGDPQADAAHLANHLAFTALARGGDHEDWLDERVPEWESMDETALGERLVADAEKTEYPQVFEDTTERGHAHDHDDEGSGHTPETGAATVPDAMLARARDRLDGADAEDADEVLAEARKLTRKRRGSDGGEQDGPDGAGDSETE